MLRNMDSVYMVVLWLFYVDVILFIGMPVVGVGVVMLDID